MNNLKGKLKYNKYNEECKISVHDLGRPPVDMYDRLDTFLAFIDYSLKERNRLNQSKPGIKEIGEFVGNSVFTASLKGENFGKLYDFLKNYPTVYEYCKNMYAIDNSAFIDRLVESGKKPINNVENLEEYMNLAIDYWILKREAFLKKRRLDSPISGLIKKTAYMLGRIRKGGGAWRFLPLRGVARR